MQRIKNVGLVPFYSAQENNVIFDSLIETNIYGQKEPFLYLREFLLKDNIELETINRKRISKYDAVVFLRLDILTIVKCLILRRQILYLSFEPPVIQRLHNKENLLLISKIFDKVLTWNDDIIDNFRIFKFYYPVSEVGLDITSLPFDKKKLLTIISANKNSSNKNELYSERKKAISYFSNKLTDFEFYGRSWNSDEFAKYKGEIKDKIDVLRNYKFALCYENETNINGLVSEKILHAFIAKSIPIYYGASNIEEFVPKDCFIDFRDFDSYDKLYNYISNMNSEIYYKYVLNIEKFMLSEDYNKFSTEYFSRTIYDSLIVPTEINKIFRCVNILLLIFLKLKYKLFGG